MTNFTYTNVVSSLVSNAGKITFAMLLIINGNFSLASPLVTGVFIGEGKISQDAKVRIEGQGFGNKADSAAVFVDYVSEAYENGQRNRVYAEYSDGRVILPTSEDPDSLWAAATSTLPVRFDTDTTPRHHYDKARYHLFGENVWLGRPVAYGGPSGWDTPKNNSQLYVSWWVKVEFNSTYYWRFKPYDISGEFSPRENIQSGGDIIGEYIGVDDEGLLNFIFPGHINANKLRNLELVGEKSGSKTIFPDNFRGGDGFGYEAPGTKTLRIWDHPDSKGIRTSLSHTDYFLSAYSNSDYSSNRVYQIRNMVPGIWHHFEVELDVEKGTFKSWFNGEMGGVANFDPRAAYQEAYSPTISLIGNNAKQDKLQNMYISEIYMDKTVQRIIIGDGPIYDDLNHYELQMPIQWKDDEIEFSVNLGALDSSSNLYLYVFDENGVPNREGFALCTGVNCPSPPEPIRLQVN